MLIPAALCIGAAYAGERRLASAEIVGDPMQTPCAHRRRLADRIGSRRRIL